MNGLELRKAALEAAGWEARRITPVWTDLFDDVGEFILGGTGNVWDDAPPVESSVDQALKWLKLPRYHTWELYPMQSEPPYIVDDHSTATIYKLLNGDDVACGEDESLPVAMCQAYLKFKG